MKLQSDLEPKMEIAEKRYPRVLKLLGDYAEYTDEHGDEDLSRYRELEAALADLTGKDMAVYNLWEWWEEEGLEVLAFRISLPAPDKVDAITREELTEIVKRLKEDIYESSGGEDFSAEFAYYLGDYYHELLELHFRNYSSSLFDRQKDKAGNYFEYTVDEITKLLWDKN